MRELLKNIPLFENLDEFHLGKIESGGSLHRHAKDKVLFIEGEEGSSLFIVVEGQVKLFKSSAEEKETVVKICGPGEMFAEVIMFEAARYPVSAIVLSPVTLFSLSKKAFNDLLKDEEFRNAFLGKLMGKLRFLAQRVHQLSSLGMEERLVDYLRQNYGEKGDYKISFSKKEFANAIGATPETLSRLLQRFQKQELLEWKGDSLVVSNKLWELY